MAVMKKTDLSRTLVRKPTAPERARPSGLAFHGLIEPLIVPEPTGLDFLGVASREDADTVWGWMQRQLAPDLVSGLPEIERGGAAALEAQVPELIRRADAALKANRPDSRGVRAYIASSSGSGGGGGDVMSVLPSVLNALKYRHYVSQARQFGQAANAISEAALVQALSVLPVSDPGPFSVLLYAAAAELHQPARMVQAVIRIAGAPNEQAIARIGYVPVIDALLIQAFVQVLALKEAIRDANVDRMCKAIDRYHRLARAVTAFIELPRRGRWTHLAGTMTKTMSDLIEPLLHRVAPDVNRALRKPRDSSDSIDDLQVQSATDGCRLLATVRDCRDSLAVNAVCEQAWIQTGELLEAQIQRMMEQLRASPSDVLMSERIDAAIGMAARRFGTEYAEVLRRARETVSRRAG